MKLWIFIFWCVSSLAAANCKIYYKDEPLQNKMTDPLFFVLSNASFCPHSIQDLKQLMHNHGLKSQVSMVANRGRNNPSEGSFSFFESISGVMTTGQTIKKGDFFLGHFTALNGTTIVLDQQPENKKLLIEIIAWDEQKGLYNFYELRGSGQEWPLWFYRGDSTDAYKDNAWLYRKKPENEPHFGNRMRCSACHNSGGPILKEQAQPHNDWWTANRPLIFSPNTLDADTLSQVNQIIDTEQFAQAVSAGAKQLARSDKMIHFYKQLSFQEQLRPLFCTTEINLESSPDDNQKQVLIPSAFWLNPLLGRIDLSLSVKDYKQLLEEFDMRFPENSQSDADHSWLSPVKGIADIRAIKDLIKHKTITKHFAEAVLMIDFTHPLFSSQRCELLQLLPLKMKKQWIQEFLSNLKKRGGAMDGADLLAEYIINEHHEFLPVIEQYKAAITQLLSTYQGLKISYKQLIELRKQVYISELSQNPAGQILEPGFRVIFPVSTL